MKFFLDLMSRVAENFNTDKGDYRSDMGILAVAAMFEEHCGSNANFLRYANCSKLAQRKKDFLVGEMVKTVFTPVNLNRWCNRLLAFHLPEPPASVFTSQQYDADIVSPVHLIVDALVKDREVLPSGFWANVLGTQRGDTSVDGTFPFILLVVCNPRGSFIARFIL